MCVAVLALLRLLLLLLLHETQPLAVAHYGHHGVEAVEAGREGNRLVEVEHRAHGVDHEPQQPLLGIFLGQGPVGDDAQGRGEGVVERHRAVGHLHEQQVDARPQGHKRCHGCAHEPPREVGDGHCRLLVVPAALVLAQLPRQEAVDGHGDVEKLHAEVGIEASLEIEHAVHGWHDDAHEPKPDVGLVLEIEVEQAQQGAEGVEQVQGLAQPLQYVGDIGHELVGSCGLEP